MLFANGALPNIEMAILPVNPSANEIEACCGDPPEPFAIEISVNALSVLDEPV